MDKLKINCKRCKKNNFFCMEDLKFRKQHFCNDCGALILSYSYANFKNLND